MKARMCVAVVAAAGSIAQAQIGERPAIEFHLDQNSVNMGLVTIRELFNHGQILFDARFNALDGQGRPATTGGGAPRVPDEPFMIRTSGPDATACVGCHNQPRSGGAGDFVANVFVLAQTLDPVTKSVDPAFSNERNSLGMNGAGAIEMLAREMTAELHLIRDAAKDKAAQTGNPVTRSLKAKGVSFGTITAMPDGKIDPSGIEGCDWDLIIKPFHQKGAVISLREFTNNAMNHHHGIQTTERFGVGTDPDMDGVIDEMSVGDVTATTIYQAALNTPVQVLPSDPVRREAVRQGFEVFKAVGCAECHVPMMTLNSRYFSEPNPYNPAGNLRLSDVPAPLVFDLTRDIQAPALERHAGGGAVVRAYTDLKRHDLNDDDYAFFANEQVPQGSILGTALASDFTIAPFPRPTREFLTRKLWDAGSTAPYGHRGDLSMLTQAIYYHGGDARAIRDAYFALSTTDQAAVIEFLKAQQVIEPQ